HSSSGAVEVRIHVLVVIAVAVHGSLERREKDAGGVRRTVAFGRKFFGAPAYDFSELLRLGDRVDEAPVLGALSLYAFGLGAEQIGVIAADFPLVRETGQPAGPGQHTQQWNFGQTN